MLRAMLDEQRGAGIVSQHAKSGHRAVLLLVSLTLYDGPVASMNPPLKFVAIAFNDYGGIGFEFYSTVVKPYFEGLREKEAAAGGSGWDDMMHHDSQGYS
jgi:hypothetical protein